MLSAETQAPGQRSPGLRRIRSSSSWGSLPHMGADEKAAAAGALRGLIAPFLNLWGTSSLGRMAGSTWLVHIALVFVQVGVTSFPDSDKAIYTTDTFAVVYM